MKAIIPLLPFLLISTSLSTPLPLDSQYELGKQLDTPLIDRKFPTKGSKFKNPAAASALHAAHENGSFNRRPGSTIPVKMGKKIGNAGARAGDVGEKGGEKGQRGHEGFEKGWNRGVDGEEAEEVDSWGPNGSPTGRVEGKGGRGVGIKRAGNRAEGGAGEVVEGRQEKIDKRDLIPSAGLVKRGDSADAKMAEKLRTGQHGGRVGMIKGWLDGIVTWQEGQREPVERDKSGDGRVEALFVGRTGQDGRDDWARFGEIYENERIHGKSEYDSDDSTIVEVGSDDEGYTTRDRAWQEKASNLISQSSLAGDWEDNERERAGLLKRAVNVAMHASINEHQTLTVEEANIDQESLEKAIATARKEEIEKQKKERIMDAKKEIDAISNADGSLADGEEDYEDSDEDYYSDVDLVGPWGYLQNDSIF